MPDISVRLSLALIFIVSIYHFNIQQTLKRYDIYVLAHDQLLMRLDRILIKMIQVALENASQNANSVFLGFVIDSRYYKDS